VTVKLDVEIVVGLMSLLKVTAILVVVPTPVVPGAGTAALTAGRVVSCVAPGAEAGCPLPGAAPDAVAGSLCEELPPHPATNEISNTAMNQVSRFTQFGNWVICNPGSATSPRQTQKSSFFFPA
jgi:hypothetical protein